MTAIELFAGGGGAALGLHRAGVQALAYVEWDRAACATLRAALAAGMLGGGEVIEGDVDLVDFRRFRGVDLLWSSFPCQAWSAAGKRLGAKDERNKWPATVRAIDEAQPTWLLAENVPGLLMHSGAAHEGDPDRRRELPDDCPGCYFRGVILPDLRARFAFVAYHVLNAVDWGVPQHRRRVYIVAGPRPVPAPKPTHAEESAAVGLFAPRLPRWRTVRDALGDLDVRAVATAHGPGVPMAARAVHDLTDRPALTVSASHGMGAGMMFVETAQTSARRAGRVPLVSSIDCPAPTVRAQEGRGLGLTDGRPRRATRAGTEPHRLDQPAPTVTTTEIKGSGEGGNPQKMQRASDALWLATGRRRLTPAECAALQAFPPDWPFAGTKTEVYRQIGNACPATMVAALADVLVAAQDRESPSTALAR